MPILRYEPGEQVPVADTYALVGHYGESKGLAVVCDAGDRLPLAVADDGPVWWVRVSADKTATQAA